MMQTSIKKLPNVHEEWKSSLSFFKDEIKVFTNRLNEIAEKNNTRPVLEKIEQFQNQLDIHNEKINDLIHEIDDYIHYIAIESRTMAGHISQQTAQKFDLLKGKVESATLLFLGFKFEFRHYIETVL